MGWQVEVLLVSDDLPNLLQTEGERGAWQLVLAHSHQLALVLVCAQASKSAGQGPISNKPSLLTYDAQPQHGAPTFTSTHLHLCSRVRTRTRAHPHCRARLMAHVFLTIRLQTDNRSATPAPCFHVRPGQGTGDRGERALRFLALVRQFRKGQRLRRGTLNAVTEPA